MSITTHHRMPHRTRRHGARAAPPAPRLPARLRAALAGPALDRRLADGADPAGDAKLAARAWQLTRQRERERIALAFEAILLDEQRPWSQHDAPRPIWRAEVDVAYDEIDCLVERLRERTPVHPRGVALARGLLKDADGPLYAEDAKDELWLLVRTAFVALG